jgi:chromosome segregation ATPase
LNPQIEDLK